MYDVIWSGGVVCDDFFYVFRGFCLVVKFLFVILQLDMGVVPINLNKDVVRYHYK